MTSPSEDLLSALQLEAMMQQLPGGDIQLRDDRHKTTWSANVQPFALAKTPLTQALYEAVMGTNPSTFVGPARPVEHVSWFDAIAFCNRLSEAAGLTPCYTIDEGGEEVSWQRDADGYRLATDAEWEYACRAGSRAVRYGDLHDIAWYAENSDESTQDVAQKAPNPWGLYDMLGNVWEWCWDLYDPKEYGTYRIFRGGGWFDPERGCLASNRRRSHPTYQIDDLGFRIAQNAP